LRSALPSPKKAADAPAPAPGDAAKRDPYEELQRLATPSMLIMVNYVTVLIETESAGKLQQALSIKRRVYEMYHRLSAKDQERLANGVVPAVGDIPVMPYSKVRGTLDRVVAEMEQYLELAAKRAALEAEEELRRRLEEEDSLLDSSVADESVKATDPKQLRKERREKYAQQRKLDAAKRVEVTKQRKALYEMIQTDRITAIFNARSRAGAPVEAPGWGEENEQEVAALNNEMDVLTATLVGSAIEGDEKHDAALARKQRAANNASHSSEAAVTVAEEEDER
jgi:hypothetical protein